MCTNCNQNNQVQLKTAAELKQWQDDYLNGRLVYPTLNGSVKLLPESVEPEIPQIEPSEKEMIVSMLKQKGIKFKLNQSVANLRLLLDQSNEK